MSQSTPTLRAPAVASAAAPEREAANALPAGYRLHEFELRGVIGAGGFGIVYRAFDRTLEREVAIKEYMPSALAGRSSKQQVSLLSASHAETFALGLASFVNEAKLLARFDHPSLVKVHRFWEDNGTAYMVMPLYRGTTLRALRQNADACPDEAWLMRLLDHLLGALDVMHHEGVFHRDIAPDNILVAGDAPPVLLDFGAARRVISDRSQTLTAILKPSYAPLEQYAESTGMRQGPWTDFYALGATLHFLLTGKPPLPATARALGDDQPRLAGSGLGGVSDRLLQVCDWMLAPRPQERPQHVAELRAALAGTLSVPQRERAAASAHAWHTTVVQGEGQSGELGASVFGPSELPVPQAQVSRRRQPARAIWATAAVMVLTAAAGLWWATHGSADGATPAVAPAAASDGARPSEAAAPTTATESRDAPAAAPTLAAPVPAAAVSLAQAAALPGAPTPRLTPAPPTGRTRVAAAPARKAEKRTPAAAAHAPADPAANLPRADAGVQQPALPPLRRAGGTDAMPVAAAPVSVAVAARNPRERCAGRHLVAMHRCLVRECEKPEHQAHRECRRVRDIEARARNLGGG